MGGSRFYVVACLLGLLVGATSAFGQRRMEMLDRSLVAVPTSAGVLVQWRMTGPEYGANATYNLYRGATLVKSGLTVSNYVDTQSNGDGYTVSVVLNGVEQARSAAVKPLANVYFKIPVRAINGGYDAYEVNDASVGDLDGDGEYEIVVKRLAVDATPSATTYHYLEAYKLNGTFMWAINLGPNMINKVEVNFLVYDLDGDGKAEVATRTSDGFTDGVGNYIGDRDGDGQISYRATAALNSSYYRIDGPDYISIFEGATGKEVAWNWYIDREPMSQWGTSGMNDSQLSHRAEKCMWSVAYLDGVNPSFIISRGIYHRIKLEAWHYRNGVLVKEWAFDSDPNGVATTYTGSGYHNFIVGDVDGDGRDEIMYGSMGVDEYGKGMYSTGFGHGDAQHLADINPDSKGLEHFACLEGANGSTIPGLALRNATTGSIQWKLNASGDIGRCMVADIDESHKGYEMWGSEGSGIYSSTGELISTTQPTTAGGGATYNFGIWWDGDVMRELLDRTVITKWNATNQSTDRVATLYNITSIIANNSTKSNPSLMADIMGDWREEIIYPSSDNSGLVIFVTPYNTSQKMYTLMHDPYYRTAISWQQNSYNQPPNLGFYFGVGMSAPPVPNITLVEPTSSSKRFVYEYDNSGDMSWEHVASWTPARLPTATDTAIIRTGEVQIKTDIASPVVVESSGIFRTIGNLAIARLNLQGGTLKVNSSNATYGMAAPVVVEQASYIMAGSNPVTVFNSDLVFTGSGRLTKTSYGILELQKSSPDFTGNWFVEAGTLSLDATHAVGSGSVVVADTGALLVNVAGGLAGCDTLVLQTGSKITLNAADTVNYLVLGDSIVPAGLYGASDIPASLAGSASLLVLYGEQTVNALAPPNSRPDLAYGLHRNGDRLHYQAVGNGNDLVLYNVHGVSLRRVALAPGKGAMGLQDLLPGQGLFLVVIEHNGVVKSRVLVVK